MAVPVNEYPLIIIKLSITPSTYAFTEQTPPTITIEVTSHAEVPITIFTWGSPFDVRSALTRNGFVIIDRATELAVPTTQTLIQRGRVGTGWTRPVPTSELVHQFSSGNWSSENW
ncbi:hypothetical protein KCU73_g5753, partial [Aureobasidium melanogenum]